MFIHNLQVSGWLQCNAMQCKDEEEVLKSLVIPAGFSFAGVAGVQPLNVQQQQQHGMNLLKNIMTGQKQQQEPTKTKPPQRNICFGTAKPDGAGDSGTEMLSADVSLVASGVGKGCTPEKLKSFLEGKGIHSVEVVMLTKPDVVNEVRTLTFRVSVKASEYEAALKPEVWPYRVGVRHFRAPKRKRSEGGCQISSTCPPLPLRASALSL
jgi:hypothetical protein